MERPPWNDRRGEGPPWRRAAEEGELLWWEPTLSAIPRQRARLRQAPIADRVGSHQSLSLELSLSLGPLLGIEA